MQAIENEVQKGEESSLTRSFKKVIELFFFIIIYSLERERDGAVRIKMLPYIFFQCLQKKIQSDDHHLHSVAYESIDEETSCFFFLHSMLTQCRA